MEHAAKPTAALHDFQVGARLGFGLAAAAAAYLALTPHGPHRQLLAVITAIGFVMAASVMVGPLRRRIERGDVDAHMASWCASFVAFATVVCLLDDGIHSPFVSIFFVSVAFSANTLPKRWATAIALLNVLGLLVVGMSEVIDEGELDSLVLWTAGLAATALVGASVCTERARRTKALRRSGEELVHRLARVVEYRDSDTGGHVDRMSHSSALLAAELGWTPTACRELELAAALHDVGKVAVPDSILLKPGPLTADERAVMERHCQAGFDMLSGSDSDLLELGATIALTHHERYDGAGYPAGLHGDDIPLAGRIVAVADVFDALTSDRVYKRAMSIGDAAAIIREGRGTQFDARVVDAFLARLDCVAALYGKTVDGGGAAIEDPLLVAA